MKTNEEEKARIEQILIEKAMKDPQFRQKLIENPRETLSAEFGYSIPEQISIHVVEEDTTTFYLVLPRPRAAQQEFELTEEDLKLVAGGGDGYTEEGVCSTESGSEYC